jgi:ABC-type lipopolysaccharide export system ATPase subunit
MKEMMRNLRETLSIILISMADKSFFINWHLDAVFSVDEYSNIHTEATMKLGGGAARL